MERIPYRLCRSDAGWKTAERVIGVGSADWSTRLQPTFRGDLTSGLFSRVGQDAVRAVRRESVLPQKECQDTVLRWSANGLVRLHEHCRAHPRMDAALEVQYANLIQLFGVGPARCDKVLFGLALGRFDRCS